VRERERERASGKERERDSFKSLQKVVFYPIQKKVGRKIHESWMQKMTIDLKSSKIVIVSFVA
jgi:hypothetical protein